MSNLSSGKPDEDETPFLVHIFCRVGGFHRPEDFISGSLPPLTSVHTWSSCTLRQLALELAEASPPSLPSPAYGTRLGFQLVFPDLRRTNAVPNGPPRYGVKDLGSVVIGAQQAENDDEVSLDTGDEDKTLGDARFVVGDYISCAILPPLDDGSVAPISFARSEPTCSLQDGRAPRRTDVSGPRNHAVHRFENGRGGRGGHRGGGNGSGGFPTGEWRRGEQLPQGRSRGGRGRGRW